MSRTRDWRRWKSDVKVLRRMKKQSRRFFWFRFLDVNGVYLDRPRWFDLIGSQQAYLLKSQTTLSWFRHYKGKWGKKGKKSYNYSSDYDTRIKDKVRFMKELKEYGY